MCLWDEEGVDEALWAVHLSMVEKAQANRAELLKIAVSALTGLLGAPRP